MRPTARCPRLITIRLYCTDKEEVLAWVNKYWHNPEELAVRYCPDGRGDYLKYYHHNYHLYLERVERCKNESTAA